MPEYNNFWPLCLIILIPLIGAILNGFLLSWIGFILGYVTRWIINRARLIPYINKYINYKIPDRKKIPQIQKLFTSEEIIHSVSVGFIFTTFILAITIIYYYLYPLQKINPQSILKYTLWNWIDMTSELVAPDLKFDITLRLDSISSIMVLVVTGVGSLIHLFSIGYMLADKSYRRFFTYMNLFIFFMLILVLADSLPILFVGWEGVGLCSYLLIGFWFEKIQNSIAAKKAFIVNRIGDMAFIIGIMIIANKTHYLDWDGLASHIDPLLRSEWHGITFATIVAFALFIGAVGKSAQIPLYVWLPDAMAGPTPVSALIHAATMVTAGIYMVTRLNFLYLSSIPVMAIMGFIGAFTALFAATIGVLQNDIKKILAYSTISQLGYMFIGTAVGAFSAGMFHLVTHAFFKSCLFLAAGSVIHSLKGKQDIREMGGLRHHLPITYFAFLAATLAIIAFPFTSGFFSKDEILIGAYSTTIFEHLKVFNISLAWLGKFFFIMGIITAFITAYYMIRVLWLTFHGTSRIKKLILADMHKPAISMNTSVIILGFLSVVGGYIGLPAFFGGNNYFNTWLLLPSISINELSFSTELILIIISATITLAGAFTAYFIYRNDDFKIAHRIAAKLPNLYNLVLSKYKIDELYEYIIIKPFRVIAQIAYLIFDSFLIDGLVRFVGYITIVVGNLVRYILHGSGKIQRYVMIMSFGVFVLFVYSGWPRGDISVTTEQGMVQINVTPYQGYTYKFDMNNDGRWEKQSSQPYFFYRYEAPGTYNIKVLITNPWGISIRKQAQVIVERGN